MTTRTLMMLRHGKSAHPDGVRDEERPLAKRGRKDIPHVAEEMRRQNLIPDLVVCSPSERTRRTADLLLETLDERIQTVFVADLYLAEAEDIARIVAELPRESLNPLLVGHNPGTETFARKLAGNDFPHDKFPTGTLAAFRLEADDWKEVTGQNAELVAFLRPRGLS